MAPLCEASGCLRILEESGEGLPATVLALLLAELHTAVGFFYVEEGGFLSRIHPSFSRLWHADFGRRSKLR